MKVDSLSPDGREKPGTHEKADGSDGDFIAYSRAPWLQCSSPGNGISDVKNCIFCEVAWLQDHPQSTWPVWGNPNGPSAVTSNGSFPRFSLSLPAQDWVEKDEETLETNPSGCQSRLAQVPTGQSPLLERARSFASLPRMLFLALTCQTPVHGWLPAVQGSGEQWQHSYYKKKKNYPSLPAILPILTTESAGLTQTCPIFDLCPPSHPHWTLFIVYHNKQLS